MRDRPTPPTGVEQLLRDQWDHLRSWLHREDVLARGHEPSGLGGWTIRDLVAHLGHGLHMIVDVAPARGEQPISITAYVAGYQPARARIEADTAEVATGMGEDVLGGVDRLVDGAWRALSTGVPDLVRGRRGVLSREDFLRTRLIELVVHGDDLHRVISPQRPSPLRTESVDAVAAVLTHGYTERTGRRPSSTGLDLIREATGRVPSDDPAMPLLS
jgi:uncharacterized protein (TIGR03083 family)